MHKADSGLISKGLPAAPLTCPHPTPVPAHRVGRKRKTRGQFPNGWREAVKLCPSKPSRRGASSPAPIWESGEQNPSPLHPLLPGAGGGGHQHGGPVSSHNHKLSPRLGPIHPAFIYHVCTAHHKMPASCQLNKHSVCIF